MAKGILISLAVVAALAAALVAGGLFYLSNSDGTNPFGGLRGPLFYDGCDPGGRLTTPMLKDAALHLDAPSGRRDGVLVVAPHDMLFEPACATGSIAITYRGNLDAIYDELAPEIAAAGWTLDSTPTPRPAGTRATDYVKKVAGVYYHLTLAESPATRYTGASTGIVIAIPDAHDVNRFRTIDTG